MRKSEHSRTLDSMESAHFVAKSHYLLEDDGFTRDRQQP
jgi:hypothetical protein